MSGVNAPDNALGSFTGTLDWNPSVLDYSSNTGIGAGFTGIVNANNAAAGHLIFNGAKPTGTTGAFTVVTITFNVVAQERATWIWHTRPWLPLLPSRICCQSSRYRRSRSGWLANLAAARPCRLR